MGLLTIAAVVGVVLFVIVRRMLGTPLVAGDLFAPPLVLVGIGLYQLHTSMGLNHLNSIGTGPALGLLAALAVGFGCGAARGTTIRLLSRDGVLRQRYTLFTLLVWAGSLAAGAGVSMLAASAGAGVDLRPMTLSIGVGMLGETLTLAVRALSTGLPFSADQRRGNSWADRLVDTVHAARPVTPPPDGHLDHSPTLRDAVARLAGASR